MIAIELDRDTVAAGEFVTARVRWAADHDRAARQILAALEWRTEGKGNTARGIGRAMRFVPPRRDDRAAVFPVHLMVPHEGPVSFAGELTAIVWHLRVRVDQRGPDEIAEVAFRVTLRHHC